MVETQTIIASGTGTVTTKMYAYKPKVRSIFVPPEDPPELKISVVVLAINLWKEYTLNCLKSIVSYYPYRILLIDNGSTDETQKGAEKLVSMNWKNLTYWRNEENIGCQRSWNLAIKDSFEKSWDYVFVINNDVLLHQRCIKRLVERFERNDDVVLVSTLDIRGECIIAEDIFKKDDKEKENVPESEHPNFSGFMVNRRWLEEVGEFDEGFFPAYFEDNDMHYRIKLAGKKAVCYPPALFYHYGSRTQQDLRYPGGLVPGDRFLKNRDYFIEKWGGVAGQERFKNPFNDLNKSLKWTKQSEK